MALVGTGASIFFLLHSSRQSSVGSHLILCSPLSLLLRLPNWNSITLRRTARARATRTTTSASHHRRRRCRNRRASYSRSKCACGRRSTATTVDGGLRLLWLSRTTLRRRTATTRSGRHRRCRRRIRRSRCRATTATTRACRHQSWQHQWIIWTSSIRSIRSTTGCITSA